MDSGDSMKVGNTFWLNLVMKTYFFTHVLDRSPRNAYMPCEFRLAVKKTNCCLPSDFFLNIPMSFNVLNFAFNELCDLTNLKKLIIGSCLTPIIQYYMNNLKIYIFMSMIYTKCSLVFISFC